MIKNELIRLKCAFGFSLAGLKFAMGEAAFRTELLACVAMTPLAFIIAHSGVERALLLGSLLLVIIVELLNTAVEKTIDRISLELHPLSKAAKDTASAAVLLSIINAVVIWLCVWVG